MNSSTLKYKAHLDWLARRWGLPESDRAAVLALLEASAEGSTAVEVCGEEFGGGNAVGGERGESPLVRVAWNGREYLQSRRTFEAENLVARELVRLAGIEYADGGELSDEEREGMFPGQDADDPQIVAVETAWRRALTLVTGGPGTGKTHTLARILLRLAMGGIRGGEIVLAAPTGKAADRMKQSVLDAIGGLPASLSSYFPELEQAAQGSGTLHRWLGRRNRIESGTIGRVLILDECSMMDLVLWEAVLGMPVEGRRLILLGDPEQLESVGQGNVLAALVAEAGRMDSPLHGGHVHLERSHRFRDCPGILRLAEALRASDAGEVLEILRASLKTPEEAGKGIAWIETEGGVPPVRLLPEEVLQGWREIAQAPDEERALAGLRKLCVLTAHREGAAGAAGMNAAIEGWLASQGGSRFAPVLIQRNDAETGLRNGSVGVLRGGRAWFPGSGGGLSGFSSGQLPEHGPAWAMTIHRSQGSEYEHVVVVLPRAGSPLLGKELLYTAITRARRQVTILGSADAIRSAVNTSGGRTTLLAAAWERIKDA